MGNDVAVNPLFTIKPRIDPLLGVKRVKNPDIYEVEYNHSNL